VAHGQCSLPGCLRQTQRSAGNGYSLRYCKQHVEHHRRHGSYWHRSLTATELLPFMQAARKWLRHWRDDPRVKSAVVAIDNLLQGAGRHENAYHIRGKPPEARARFALARLRKAEIDPLIILERTLAVSACCVAKGIDERQREYRHVQIAKSVHRLASGTHRTPSGFPLPSKYPRSEGQVLRYLGRWLDEIALFAADGRDILTDQVDE
jgi:hypothetical protein